MWVPVHDDEWDGDVPLGLDRPPTPEKHSKGEVTFRGDTLPWLVGRYEVKSYNLVKLMFMKLTLFP
jgi:phosphatidylethanolamine N-methyltransferase